MAGMCCSVNIPHQFAPCDGHCHVKMVHNLCADYKSYGNYQPSDMVSNQVDGQCFKISNDHMPISCHRRPALVLLEEVFLEVAARVVLPRPERR